MDPQFLLPLKLVVIKDYECILPVIKLNIAVCCCDHYLCKQLKIYGQKVSRRKKLKLRSRVTANGSPN